MFQLVEKIITIGGEAPLIGMPIYLIRFTGCNLECSYCDTNYKNEINDQFTFNELIDDIFNKVKEFPELKVLFTGGEPLLDDRQNELINIISELENIDFYIETNGSIKINNFNLTNCYYIVDWKSPSSGNNEDSFFIENLHKLRLEKDCIKFVINNNDFNWLKETIKIIQKINPFITLYISPQQGRLSLKETADFIIKNKLPARLSLQLHKIIWPNKNRGI
jgi:7-carboxy-7-deazaguanine synthase